MVVGSATNAPRGRREDGCGAGSASETPPTMRETPPTKCKNRERSQAPMTPAIAARWKIRSQPTIPSRRLASAVGMRP